MTTKQALACSCLTDWTSVGQMVDDYDYVFKGEVLYIDDRIPVGIQGNRLARFKVERVFKGPKASKTSIYYNFGPQSCMHRHYVTGDAHLVFASKMDDGTFSTSEICGESDVIYDKEQVSSYFDNGEDSPVLSSLCAKAIELAYSAEVFLGEFSLGREDCLPAVPLFNKYYSKKSK